MPKIDRKAAARLLKVSIRTVDRYIAAGKLSIDKEEKRIWLSKKEILNFRKRKRVDSGHDEMSIDIDDRQDVDMGAWLYPRVRGYNQAENPALQKGKSASGIYKKLYEETREQLQHAQGRLEGANYRVGQLEAMVKESVPLPQHQRLLGEEKAQRLELEEHVETLRDKLEKLKARLKDEKVTRKVYLIALFIILLLQPLWLLLVR